MTASSQPSAAGSLHNGPGVSYTGSFMSLNSARVKPSNLPSVTSRAASLQHPHGPALSPDETTSEMDYDLSSCGTTPPTPSTPIRASTTVNDLAADDDSSVFHAGSSISMGVFSLIVTV